MQPKNAFVELLNTAYYIPITAKIRYCYLTNSPNRFQNLLGLFYIFYFEIFQLVAIT